jgi:hypothetical protein
LAREWRSGLPQEIGPNLTTIPIRGNGSRWMQIRALFEKHLSTVCFTAVSPLLLRVQNFEMGVFMSEGAGQGPGGTLQRENRTIGQTRGVRLGTKSTITLPERVASESESIGIFRELSRRSGRSEQLWNQVLARRSDQIELTFTLRGGHGFERLDLAGHGDEVGGGKQAGGFE